MSEDGIFFDDDVILDLMSYSCMSRNESQTRASWEAYCAPRILQYEMVRNDLSLEQIHRKGLYR